MSETPHASTTTLKLPGPASPSGGGRRPTPRGAPPRGNSKLMLLGVIVAVVAVVLQNAYIEMVRYQARPGEFTVFRLERDVSAGERITRQDVRPVAMPAEFRRTFQHAVPRDELEAQFDRPLPRAASQYSILTRDLFTDEYDRALDQLVTSGRRAVTLPADDDRIPADLRPGMFVDIEGPFPRRGGATAGREIPEIIPVMEHVRLLAVGRRTLLDEQLGVPRTRGSGTRVGTVTIEVTPEQATQLAEIQLLAVGPFYLHMRNPGDAQQRKISTGGVNLRLLQWIGRDAEAGGD